VLEEMLGMDSHHHFLVLAAGLAAAVAGGCKSAPAPIPVAAAPAADGPPIAVESGLLASPVRQAAAMEPVVTLAQEPPADRLPRPTAPTTPLEAIPIAPAEATQPARMSLLDAVELALDQNPDLTAQRYAEGVSEGALGVAQTYPLNPWVQIQVLPGSSNPTGDDDTTSHYVLLMQQLQLAHQRRYRAEAAEAALNSVRWNFVMAKLANMAQTQRLYFTAIYRQELAELAAAIARISAESLAIAERQLAAGAITGADVAIARLEEQSARQQAQLAGANYQTALLDLRRQLGLPLTAPLELSGGLGDLRWHTFSGPVPAWLKFVEADLAEVQSPESLARHLAAGRPDVSAAASDFFAARANLDLARANRCPDLIVGPYYQRDDDSTTQWGLRAQMDLPVLNSGMPLVRQRMAELNQRRALWEQLLVRASLEAETAIQRYERALAATGSRAGAATLPAELQKLEEQFRAGEVDMVQIVAARTSFLRARQAELDNLNELAQAAAAVVAATGLPPQAVVEQP
jgi:cobalt-zinc-cadmium efflux system outer membrane protein